MMPGGFRNKLRFLIAVTLALAAPCAMAQTEAAAVSTPAATPASTPVSALANTTASIPASALASAQFDVADVHASPFLRFPFMDGGNLSGDRYILHQATMTQIIAAAYNLDPTNVQSGPSWL